MTKAVLGPRRNARSRADSRVRPGRTGVSWSCRWRRPEHRPRISERTITRASLGVSVPPCPSQIFLCLRSQIAPRERFPRASTWPRPPRWDSVHHVWLDPRTEARAAGIRRRTAYAWHMHTTVRGAISKPSGSSQRHGGFTGNQITDATTSSTLLDLYPTTLKAHQHLLDAHKLARSLLDLCTRTRR